MSKNFNDTLNWYKVRTMYAKVDINKESQKKLENIDDKLLIALATKNLTDFTLITCREIAIQREMKRRKRALPPEYVKEVVDEIYSFTLEDKDLCSVEELKNEFETVNKEAGK